MKLKDIGKSIAKAVPYVSAAVGAYFGGPTGAQAGYTAGNTAKSLVTGNSKDFQNALKSNLSNGLSAVTGQLQGTGYEWIGDALGAVGLGNTSANSIQSNASDANLNAFNLEQQKELAKYNAGMQMQLNKQTHAQNMELWNLQNAYNSPEAQMQRYKQAGLNPNLIYDQQNTASGVPMLESPKFDTGGYSPVDTRIQRAQLALALQEHKLQIQNQAIENDMKRQHLVLSARASDREDKLADAQIKNLSASLGLRQAEFNYNTSKPQSWIGRNWSDIKSVFNETAGSVGKAVTNYFGNKYNSAKAWASSKFKEKYPNLSNFKW